MRFWTSKAVPRLPMWYSTSDSMRLSSDIRNSIGAGAQDVASSLDHAPSVPHAVLLNPKQQFAIIGDVHGCVDELEELLERIYHNSKDTTVALVGDLVNKGPKSAETVQLVRSKGLYCVRGNHDQFVLDARHRCGRFEGVKVLPVEHSWIDDLDEAHVSFLSELPYTISIPSFNAIVVHAGIVPGLPLFLQSHNDMISMRTLIRSKEGTGLCEWITSSNDNTGCPWINEWKGPSRIFFGHDAKRGIQKTRYAKGLDTGCCYGRKLTAILLPNEELISVDAKEVYEVPKSKKYGNDVERIAASQE